MSESLWESCQTVASVISKKFWLPAEDVEDLVSELYLRWVNDPPEHIGGIYKSAKNYCIDQIRHRAIAEKYQRAIVNTATNRGKGRAVNVDKRKDLASESWLALEEYISELPQIDQDILLLEYVEATAAQGAKLLGMTLPAYKSRLYRARKKLQKVMPDATL